MTKYQLMDALKDIPDNAEIMLGCDYKDIEGFYAEVIAYNANYNQVIIGDEYSKKSKMPEIKEKQKILFEESLYDYQDD